MDQGTLDFNASGTALNSGTTAGTPGFVVNPGAALLLDNNTGNVNLASRISSAATVTMNGGTFTLTGGNGAGLVGVFTSQPIGGWS